MHINNKLTVLLESSIKHLSWSDVGQLCPDFITNSDGGLWVFSPLELNTYNSTQYIVRVQLLL